jgi:hypothetical protein
MKKILAIIVIIVLVAFFFPKKFTSSAGHVTPEIFAQFEASKARCFGFEYLTNTEATYADAPGESLCFGWLSH